MKRTSSRLSQLFITVTLLCLLTLSCAAALPTNITPLTEAPDGFTAITTADELVNMSPDKSYILLADIDLSDAAFSPIGSIGSPFTGVFDGNGHSITGLDITSSTAYTSLFACCDGAEIKNLSVTGTIITVNTASNPAYAAVICAKAQNGTLIENCYTEASVNVTSTGDVYAAGICAYADGSTVKGCISDTDITATANGDVANIGGICGYLFANSLIDSCTNHGALTGLSDDEVYVGGIVGVTKRDLSNTSRAKPQATYCTNDADISVVTKEKISVYCAGIAAKAEHLVITGCMNTGDITVETVIGASAGGIAGYYSRNTLDKCANTGNISAVSTSADAYASGIIAEANVATVTNSYNTGSFFAEGVQSSNSGGISAHCTQADKFKTSYNAGENLSETGTSAGTLIGASAYDDTRTSLYTLESETHPAIGNREDTSAVTVLTQAQILSQDSFAGLDFDAVWYMPEDGGSPMLQIFKPEPELLYGDVDNDGDVDSTDSVVLSRNLAKWSGYEDAVNATNSDLNGDGSVDSNDSVILARFLAKWDGYKSLPIA